MVPARFTPKTFGNLWLLGSKSVNPDVSIPVTMIGIIGSSGSVQMPERLHFMEVCLYWDTALLSPFLAKEAVLFKTENVLRADGIEA